jgi:hypothetical protein
MLPNNAAASASVAGGNGSVTSPVPRNSIRSELDSGLQGSGKYRRSSSGIPIAIALAQPLSRGPNTLRMVPKRE